MSDDAPAPAAGFLCDTHGDHSSKRLFGLIALLDLSAALFIAMFTGKTPDVTIVLALGGVVLGAIGGAAAEFFAAAVQVEKK